MPGVADVRVLGAIGVVQLDREVDIAAATAAAVRTGVWLRPFRDLIYTMPPYITSDEDLARICRAILAAAEASTAEASTAQAGTAQASTAQASSAQASSAQAGTGQAG
jgi:adenosylmethionine-8-amino-7-oxononanoate aminotransferase